MMELKPASVVVYCAAISLLIARSFQTDTAETQVSLLQRLNGHIFRDNVLFHILSLSPIHCAHVCLAEGACVMFSFTAAREQWSRCRGHSAVTGLGRSISRQDPGSRVFVLEERANGEN